MSINNTDKSFLTKIGISSHLSWGYLGVLIFMMSDGIEQGWLSPYLVNHGLSVEQSASLFTVYGITVAVSSWFSGVLVEGFGAKKTMAAGFIVYLLGSAGFVGYGASALNYPVMLATYGFRGLGYPLFAYSFLVWITYRTPKKMLGRAVGWFWFVFTGGLVVLGSYFSSWAIVQFGHINTLWSSLFWASLGAFFALALNTDDKAPKGEPGKLSDKAHELFKGFSIIKEEPKVLLGGVVRIINTTAQFAFPVFLPLYLAQYGLSTTEWLQIWGTIFTGNIIFNLIFGFVGDRLGWRNTVMWFGGVGCGFSTLLFYYTPQLTGGSFWWIMLAGMLWGGLLAGYVPLSALVPSLVEEEKGAAMAILNLGAGLPVFVGPAIVGVFIGFTGSEGIIWILAGLYFIGAFMTKFIMLPEEVESQPSVPVGLETSITGDSTVKSGGISPGTDD